MGTRRHARETAMQALFCMDMSCAFTREMLDAYCRCFAPDEPQPPFFQHLVNGIIDHHDHIDGIIEQHSNNWKIRRMACVDRNILRLAVFELLYCADIPAKVAINEAIDIGKKFGSPESGAFINGILDSIRLAIDQGRLLRRSAVTEARATAPKAVNGG
ncbi:transcription antitermination factor NusB [Desulfatitalea alkaliphila]|uniref:Transcription antitermination protein NusB n=1 Tax=Desulfatitalea alkaliphila TaxID=2929485 RepID=A0AA41UN71_9BACT|nr:transcription antitermination factor NusB [Desulfatitalea alkaliphila]MCJ8499243.1 transcription antitermination factor NusB [Desulfatitalea alkaliphila]